MGEKDNRGREIAGVSGLQELSCDECGTTTAAAAETWRCQRCGGPLVWSGPPQMNRARMAVAVPSLWRYACNLPVAIEDAVSLGEHLTPLIAGRIGDGVVLFKLDYLLPTGSYKDRGAAVLLSHLRSLGVRHALEDSSGNAAAAIAAYAARAGIACTVFAPARASAGKLVQAAAYGATVRRIEGSRDDVAGAAIRAAAEPGATYASHNWHPFFVEGVKTWAFEVWEQLGYRAPDNVVVPAGSGSMVLGAYRAFSELRVGGEIDRLPRLFAAQAAACAPLVASLAVGGDEIVPIGRGQTAAEGIMIARPVRGRALLRALRATGGGAVAVPEPEIGRALRALGRQGFYVEPTSAVAAAATATLFAEGTIRPDESTVVLLSGSGLKATEAIAGMLDGPT